MSIYKVGMVDIGRLRSELVGSIIDHVSVGFGANTSPGKINTSVPTVLRTFPYPVALKRAWYVPEQAQTGADVKLAITDPADPLTDVQAVSLAMGVTVDGIAVGSLKEFTPVRDSQGNTRAIAYPGEGGRLVAYQVGDISVGSAVASGTIIAEYALLKASPAASMLIAESVPSLGLPTILSAVKTGTLGSGTARVTLTFDRPVTPISTGLAATWFRACFTGNSGETYKATSTNPYTAFRSDGTYSATQAIRDLEMTALAGVVLAANKMSINTGAFQDADGRVMAAVTNYTLT